mgnify:FL=1
MILTINVKKTTQGETKKEAMTNMIELVTKEIRKQIRKEKLPPKRCTWDPEEVDPIVDGSALESKGDHTLLSETPIFRYDQFMTGDPIVFYIIPVQVFGLQITQNEEGYQASFAGIRMTVERYGEGLTPASYNFDTKLWEEGVKDQLKKFVKEMEERSN